MEPEEPLTRPPQGRFAGYSLLRKIATGGTAEIYLARRHGVEGFARHLAIKRILPHLAENEDFVRLILDEARLAAHLHHGHIIEIHEVGVEEGQAYIAMEYLPGTDLGRLIRAARRLKRRVLVVHTDSGWRTAVAQALSGPELEVVLAANAEEAEALSAAGRLDLAILDATLLGPIRDASLHALQAAHPELQRSLLVGPNEGRGHGLYAVNALDSRPEAVVELAKRCLKPVLPLELALQIARAVADGLEYAHAASDFAGHPLSIVHRDVNPSNILISASGVIKLVDFGIARAATSAPLEERGNFVGTYAYMSPEQASGRDADARSDIFAWGAVFAELVTGSHPFKQESEFGTLRAIREDEPPSLAECLPGVPKPLDDLARRALAKDPDARYAHAGDLHADLEAFAQQEGISLSPRRLAGFMRSVYGEAGLSRFGVSDTGYELCDLSYKAPTPIPEFEVDLSDVDRGDGPPSAPPRPKTGLKVLVMASIAILAAAVTWLVAR